MSVLRIQVSVMKVQVVIIQMVPTAVPVNRDSLEMDQLVMVSDYFGSLYYLSYCHVNCDTPSLSPQISMSVLRIPVPVMKMQIAIIRTVPTAVAVDRDSLAMEQLVTVRL